MGKSIKFEDKEGYVYVYPYYPVGSIYLSVTDINPSTYFDGTWELIAQGKTLVGVDPSDSDFNVAKKTGGEKTHTLTVAELAKHNHPVTLSGSATSMGAMFNWTYTTENYKTRTYGGADLAQYTGGGQPHNNMPPYFTCYIWLKTAL